ncbi:sulfotransferase family protein [Altibacter sp. HG106]|uniref:sulfotransferase family protein n=1 Tax=Altibacter sp. HG106 TaxID=3023937 RepID=UPI0023500DD3|nr:sulfotransferase [Altibacter sp. HG106]MDC7995720.1 sulfotransferase [Altibacter sp. HG106]
MASKVNKHIFVGGLPRSGTTLVQNLLNAHPQVYAGPEFDRIPNIVDLRNKLQRSLKAQRIDVYTTSAQIDEEIRALISTLIEPLATKESYTHLSEKTPWNILFFNELLELFPEAKFIMVLRNPLAVFNSMKNVAKKAKDQQIIPPDFTQDYRMAAGYMEAVYKLHEEILHSYPDRVTLVRYEDFINHFESTAKELFSFLEVPWNDKVLRFYELDHPGEATMTKKQIWYTSKQFKMNPAEVQSKAQLFEHLTYKERIFLQYLFRKNTFINRNQEYLQEPTLLEKAICRTIMPIYKRKFRFLNTPKRILN